MLRGNRIVIPGSLRSRILSLAHEGHLGIVRTKQNLRSKVFWPGLDADAEKLCKSCHGCQIISKSNHVEPLRTTKLSTALWSDLAVDYMGPLPSREHILVVVDYYSRWFEVAYLGSTTMEKTIVELDKMFFIHGLPQTIKSDNGPQFVSSEFQAYCEHLGITHI